MSRTGPFTALMLGGLLVLSACGGGKPASHATVQVGSVVHIGSYTQVFSTPVPANPARAAVVEGFRQGQVLWNESANAWRVLPSARGYVTGQALSHLSSAVRADKSHGLVLAGTDRFFLTRVTSITGHTAAVATCDDASKFKQIDRRTRKADARFMPTPGQAYVSETWRMVQLRGHWAISGLSVATLPSRAAEPCQPGMTGYGPSHRPGVAALLRAMTATLGNATGVHISGAISQGGKTLGVDLDITGSGEFSGRVLEKGLLLTVLGTHGHSYLKLNAAFLRVAGLPANDCRRFCGKYLKYPVTESRALRNHLSLAALTRSITSTPAREIKFMGAVTTGGQLAWLLQDSHENSVYVAAHGRPYLLREVAAPPAKGGVNLTRWNAVRIPAEPHGSQIVTASQLRAARSQPVSQ